MQGDYTAAFLLLWEMASLEAQAGTHDCIRPEHFFLALCKVDDRAVGALRDDGTPEVQEQIPGIEKELRAVRQVFEATAFDPKTARRRVRALLGQPGKRPDDGIWHRTSDARWCCDRAIRIARAWGQEAAAPLHLLRALVDPEADFPILEQVITVALRQVVQDI